MPLAYDPEVLAAIAPIIAARGDAPLPEAGDWRTRRQTADEFLPTLFAALDAPGVRSSNHATTAADGARIGLRWYEPSGGSSNAGVLYLHGGGMILGSVDVYDQAIASYVAASGVPMLAVDYRLAPEHPHPTPTEDCYAGLVWFAEHAADLGVDPDRIAVMGDSAGGGLAAAVTRMAAVRGGPRLTRQILVYPMLDDRTTSPDPELTGLVSWSYDDNITGWTALLGDLAGGPDTPWQAAPARRLDDLGGLPPAYVDVGELDIFRDEDVRYALALWAAGVPTELHVYPGCPHGFEIYASGTPVAAAAIANRVRVLRSL